MGAWEYGSWNGPLKKASNLVGGAKSNQKNQKKQNKQKKQTNILETAMKAILHDLLISVNYVHFTQFAHKCALCTFYPTNFLLFTCW